MLFLALNSFKTKIVFKNSYLKTIDIKHFYSSTKLCNTAKYKDIINDFKRK